MSNSVWYGGGLFSFLVRSEDTDGAFSIVEATTCPGSEPPMHIHEREDEAIYILQGEAEFFVGGEKFLRKSGEMMFMPRQVPHTFRILSSVAKALIYITPGGFEGYFKEAGTPAASLRLPDMKGGPGPEFLAKVQAIAPKYGITFLP